MSEYLELPWSVEYTIENLKELKHGLQERCIIQNLHGRGEKDAEEIAFDFDRAIKALEEVQQYRAIGTASELQDLVIGINALADSQFTAADMAKLVNDMKSLYEYRQIGTPEECRAAVEKMKSDEELESHDEKHILKYCISLMQEMVDEFADWYKWLHGENAISEMDDEEIFCVRKSYFRIVQKLFLFSTKHSGGTSTRAKCKQLGVDSSEEITFDWSEVE